MTYDRALIYEAPNSDPRRDRVVRRSGTGATTTIVAVPDPDAIAPVAIELVDQGARLVEICGGVSPVWRGRVARAVGGRASVSSVTFGVESLDAAQRYNRAFTEGATTEQAFILLESGADPDAGHVLLSPESVPVQLFPVPDADAAAAVAAGLAAAGVLLIELYGDFASEGVEKVIEAVGGRSAVGVGGFAADTLNTER